MKFSVCIAAVLAVSLGSSAQARPTDNSDTGMPSYSVIETDLPYHPCHGRTSGTAHESCGTLTGGPSGGLF